jgi:cell wall-associated NlpC family hydrolase
MSTISDSSSRETSSSGVTSSSSTTDVANSSSSTDEVSSPERSDEVSIDFEGVKAEEADTPRVEGLLSALAEDAPKEPTAGERLAETAREWAGKEFKPGETARCADFVSTVVEQSGINAPDFEHTVRARDFANMGEYIDPEKIAAGDVLAFNNTYRFSANDTDHTHVGIYVGEGMMVHRPTSDAPVELVSLEEYMARSSAKGVTGREFMGGYRLAE